MNEKLQQSPPSPESTQDKITRLLKEVRERMDVLDFQEEMVPFAKKIEENNPDYQQYRCYHQLIGSTPREGLSFIEEDFKGEYSVVAFLEDFIKTETGKDVLR